MNKGKMDKNKMNKNKTEKNDHEKAVPAMVLSRGNYQSFQNNEAPLNDLLDVGPLGEQVCRRAAVSFSFRFETIRT